MTGLVAYVTRPNQIISGTKTYQAVLNSIVLAKCIKSHLWENSVYVSKQLKGIGPTFSTLLATAGKLNFMLLEESHPRDLERIMNKAPPAGNILRKQISLLPKYQLTIIPSDENTVKIQLTLLNQVYLAENMDHLTAGVNHRCYIIIGDTENWLLLLTSFMDKDLIGVYDGQITLDITKKNKENKITAHCISSNFVGIDVHCEYQYKDLDKSYMIDTKSNSPKNIKAKGKHVRQTAITDSFKIRKRRNNDGNETSIEKKKCEYNIIEKIEPSNKLYGDNRSLNDEKDFYKNMQKQQSDIVYQKEGKIDEQANFELQGNDDSDKENYDDVNVSSILNKIEREIYDQEKLNNSSNSNKTKSSKIQHTKIINSLNKFNSKYRKSEKCNYTVLDSINKKHNVNNEEYSSNYNKNTFVDSVKSYIDIFLEKTKQRSNVVDSSLKNLVEIEKPDCVNNTNTIDDKIEENNKVTPKNENYTILKATGNYNNEPEIIDSLHEVSDKSLESKMSLNEDIVQTDTNPAYDNTPRDNIAAITNFLPITDNKTLNRSDTNNGNIQNDDVITSDNQYNAFNFATTLNKPISDKNNIQYIEYGDNVVQNLDNDKLSTRPEDKTESHNNINNIQQTYIPNDIQSILKGYTSIIKNPNFHDNHFECNINQITYTMDIPLTKTVYEPKPIQEIYSTARNTDTINSTSDEVQVVKANQYKNEIVTQSHPNNSNSIERALDKMENTNKNRVQCKSRSCSNCLRITQNVNNAHPINNNTTKCNYFTDELETPITNKAQRRSRLDPNCLKVTESLDTGHPNVYSDLHTSICSDINRTKKISITKTQVNVYTKNTLERKYCVMSQFQVDLDIAETNKKIRDKDATLKQTQSEYEKEINCTKMNSIKSKYDDSSVSSIHLWPSSVDDQTTNSNITDEQEVFDKSQCHNTIEMEEISKQEHSRGQKHRTLDDIIEKYKNVMSSKHKVLRPTDFKTQPITSSRQCEKVKRPFKISDLPSLHQPNVEFQNGLFSNYGTQKPIYFLPKARKDIKDNADVTKNTYELDKVKLNQDNYTINTDVECLLQPRIEENDLNDTIDMSQSMFNPKTILECLKEDIIPPPSEFRDGSVSTDQNNILGIEASSSNAYQSITEPEGYNIFESLHSSVSEGKNQSVELPKRLETWTLSQNDDAHVDPCKSFNIVLNGGSRSLRPQIIRKAKLNEFKFSRKSTFKNRK